MAFANLVLAVGQFGPWIVPAIAVLGLWCARAIGDQCIARWAEICFLALLTLAAGITLRTIVLNDNCWLLHCSSLGIMIVGAIFPFASNSAVSSNVDAI